MTSERSVSQRVLSHGCGETRFAFQRRDLEIAPRLLGMFHVINVGRMTDRLCLRLPSAAQVSAPPCRLFCLLLICGLLGLAFRVSAEEAGPYPRISEEAFKARLPFF